MTRTSTARRDGCLQRSGRYQPDLRGRKAFPVRQVPSALPALQDCKDLQVHKVQSVQPVLRAFKARRERPERRTSLPLTPTTILPAAPSWRSPKPVFALPFEISRPKQQVNLLITP